MSQVPFIDRVKIWTEILLPFYKRVQAEVGEERAAALMREAVEQYGKGLGEAVAQSVGGSSLDKLRSLVPAFTAGDALQIETIKDDEKEMSMNVRGCKYAEYFKSIGEPEFGAMITCEVDPPMTEGIGDDLELSRTQTIMRGGSHCDFRWRLR